jgi:hypothetical protein
MLESLMALLKEEKAMLNASNLCTYIADLVKVTEQNILKEGVTKNAFIDSMIQILEAHKDPVKYV